MQKTKLGISVGVMGAIVCFAALSNGYLATLLLLGYILTFESNEWLKKTAVKVVLVLVVFSLLNGVVNLVPSAISVIDAVFSIFKGSFSLSFVSSIVRVISYAFSLLEDLILIGLGLKAFNQGTIKIGFIDKLVDKQFEKTAE